MSVWEILVRGYLTTYKKISIKIEKKKKSLQFVLEIYLG